MRRVLLLFLVGGCGYTGSITTPKSDLVTYPHEVEYQLLGRVSGYACGSFDDLDSYEHRSKDAWNGRYRYVYELAKYQALSEAKDADLLIYVRTNEHVKNKQLCVELSGRAAKVVNVKSVVGPHPPASPKSLFGLP